MLPSAACGVAPPSGGTDVPVTVGGNVPGVLALTFGATPSLGTFMPGVSKDYTASVAATVTSSATAAALTVRDPSATATGHLVNGARRCRRRCRCGRMTGAFAPLSSTGAPLALTAWSTPVGARPVTVEFKQPVAATDSLLTGQLRQDADLHAVGHHAVSTGLGAGSREPAPSARTMSRG